MALRLQWVILFRRVIALAENGGSDQIGWQMTNGHLYVFLATLLLNAPKAALASFVQPLAKKVSK